MLTVQVELVSSSSRPSALAAVVTRLSRFTLCLKRCSHLLMEADSVPGSQSDKYPAHVCEGEYFCILRHTCVHASCFSFPLFWEEEVPHVPLRESLWSWVRSGKFLNIQLKEASCVEPLPVDQGQLAEQFHSLVRHCWWAKREQHNSFLLCKILELFQNVNAIKMWGLFSLNKTLNASFLLFSLF